MSAKLVVVIDDAEEMEYLIDNLCDLMEHFNNVEEMIQAIECPPQAEDTQIRYLQRLTSAVREMFPDVAPVDITLLSLDVVEDFTLTLSVSRRTDYG